MRSLVLMVLVGVVLGVGCSLPGKPEGESLVGQPSKVESFEVLYSTSCAACHGEAGRGGPALALANPVFLAIIDDASLRRVIAGGVAGTTMPGFAAASGGDLSERQLDVIVSGIRAWAKPNALAGATPPPYAGPPGDATRGAQVYERACASCHARLPSIVDGSFLALVSSQGLRTTVIAGRPEIKQPDWRGDTSGDTKGQPLTSEEVSDVVAWLVSHRPAFPGQPYPR